MANYILIHGGNMSTDTWNRLAHRNDFPAGGHLKNTCWDRTVAALRANHHCVFAPELKDENTCNLTGHIEQICKLIYVNDLHNIILTGHSYGGMIITGIADNVPARIAKLVYIDAAIPDPGQSLFDLLEMGFNIDSGEIPYLPEMIAPYMEKLQFNPENLKRIPKTYILCTNSEFINVTRLAKQKIINAKHGWTYLELPSSHVPMADMPDAFHQILLDQAIL
jgi:pimeloyl-ACP methyl ester carboxylesterase